MTHIVNLFIVFVYVWSLDSETKFWSLDITYEESHAVHKVTRGSTRKQCELSGAGLDNSSLTATRRGSTRMV
ncbi:unnamed protein product [Brassica oleracea var. botrytis]